MIRHDLVCPRCDRIEPDVTLSSQACVICVPCSTRMEILWTAPAQERIGIHPRDRAVVYEHPQTGKIVYPGRNDTPMPERYRRAGFIRKEFATLRDLDSFCKRTNHVNEAANYNPGSGKGYDDE